MKVCRCFLDLFSDQATIVLGVFIVKGKEDALATKNMVVGESVYGEKRVSVDDGSGTSIEYRVWNPFRSKLAASMMAGLENVHIKPGTKLLYLGAASGTTVSHCSDIVGPVSSLELRLRLPFSFFRCSYKAILGWNCLCC